MATAGLVKDEVTVNQSDRRSRPSAKASPDRATSPDEPTRVRLVTRPPRSPNPLRPVMVIDSSVPSCGQTDSMVDTGTSAVHVWLGLQAPGTHTASPGSGTAGKLLGAV